MSGLVEHVLAVRDLLQHVSGTSAYSKTLEGQTRSLGAQIESASFSVAEAAALAQEIKGLPNSEQEVLLAKLADRINSSTSSSSPVSGRASLQDFTNIVAFFTEETWTCLRDDKVPSNAKMEVLLQAAIKLGLRCPSETSVQVLCAVHLFMSEGMAKALALSPACKLEMARSMKSKLRSTHQLMSAGLPVQGYVTRLPATVEEYKRNYPAWWDFAFQGGDPVPNKISISELHKCMSSIPMRGSRADAKTSPSSSSGLQLASQPADQGNMMQQMLMMAMKHIEGGQPQGMKLEINRSQSEIRTLKRLQSSLALEEAPDQDSSPHHSALRSPKVPHVVPADISIAGVSEAPKQIISQPLALEARKEIIPQPTALEAAAAIADLLDSNKKSKAAEKAEEHEDNGKKLTLKPKGKAKAKAKAQPASSKVAKPRPKSASAKVEKPLIMKKPTWAYEWSRGQIVCRTGMPGKGQSCTIAGTGPASVKKAEQWLKDRS